MSSAETSIVVFRQDLRLIDNPALLAAADRGKVIPVYIYDEDEEKNGNEWAIGGASKWWLHHSLTSLQSSFAVHGLKLHIFKGNPYQILIDLSKQSRCKHIFWNRRYAAHHIETDTALKNQLQNTGIHVQSFNASLLSEPWQQFTKQNTPFKVFTAYWRHCTKRFLGESPIPAISEAPELKGTTDQLDGIDIDKLELLPKKPNWATTIESNWTPGEQHAQAAWQQFLSENISQYKQARDYPATRGTSRLSPHLAFGEISPRQIWHDVQQQLSLQQNTNLECYLSEIGWREFSYYLLYHFPNIPTENFNAKFDHFSWQKNEQHLKAWQQGKTGYPLIDAGMRELWHTGYMHNRVRMVVASFLCKDLHLHWLNGAQWFWDTLLDADLASNSASWQWCAGSGADAAPFFRIFNPVTQSEKFDADGNYIRQWVPELARLSSKFIHKPWEAPLDVRLTAKVRLGENYPNRIVDHKLAREKALALYNEIKSN